MPLPDNTADEWKINPVNEEGNVYYSILSIAGTRVPEGFIEDIFSQGDIQYGKENVDAFNRYIKWVQQSPGVWTVSLGPSNKQGIG